MRPAELGRNPSAVRAAESLMRAGCDIHKRHLSTTLEAHQKLATLSSKRPRWNGKIRLRGSRMPDRGAKGGRNGRKRTTKDATVTTAIRRNSCSLRHNEVEYVYQRPYIRLTCLWEQRTSTLRASTNRWQVRSRAPSV